MRKTYGNTWWGKQWLNALNNIDYSNRLPRGKTYANKGAVSEIEIKGHKIDAAVQGSRRAPYRVKFRIPPFSGANKAKIIALVTENPLFLSHLLNQQLPQALNQSCLQAGIHLFPHSWEDLEGSCSCPDWAVPCKHMAAALYLVANEIDKNPFLIFQLHNFDLFKGLEGIGYSVSSDREVPIVSVEEGWGNFEFDRKTYHWRADLFARLDFSNLPNCRENLLAILSEQPVFFPNGDFKKVLNRVYQKMAQAKLAFRGQDESSDLLQNLDAVEAVEIIVDEEVDFLNATFRNNRGKSLYSFNRFDELLECLQQIAFSKLELYSPHIKSLYLCYLLSEKLVQQSAVIPQLQRVGTKRFKIRWIPAMLNETVRQQFEEFAELVPSDLIFRKKGKEILSALTEEHLMHLLSLFLGYRVQNSHALPIRRMEHNISQLFFNQSVESFSAYEEQGFAEAIQLWLSKFFISEKEFVPVIMVGEKEEGFEVKLGVEDQKQSLPAPIPLAEMLSERKYQKNRIPLLRDLTMLADYFPQIGQVVASQGKESLFFNNDQFANILFKMLPTIRLFGIKILLPKALRKLLRPQISLSLEASDDGTVHSNGLVNMDNMLTFNWQVAIGDQLLDPASFLKLVEQYSGIVKLNDQYVFFDEKQIKALLKQMEQTPTLDPNELLQVALTEEYEGAKVGLSKMARKRIDALRKKKKVKVPKGLKATLRPYQHSGYEWMYKNAGLGFGSLIADDMGLGKTLQVICTLLKWKEEGHLDSAKALIIVPTSLLTNWVKEMAKFAPKLVPHVFHGPQRKLDGLDTADVLLTTYGVLRSDLKKLEKLKWQVAVIDEAQNIKNPGTAQTKAVKKVKAPIKIAMSGTPVENRLSEYWSIFDFTNQKYLGSLNHFKNHFARPIEVDRDQTKLDHFRKITEPFILRRLKSDKSIISDLPDKIEKDQFCQLTPEQAALYESVVETTMKKIEQVEGINRRGMVLKLITSLKQICNHPAQFLKKGKRDAAFSGKGQMLIDLLKQILDNGEKTLIFTQYQEMGQLIIQMMKDYFDQEVPFLHGGVSRKKRDEMVDDFQNNRSTRVFILSLKAAGTGLNLTAANNVIHYDLWWNPAVEAQATDRAYRIGQQNKVMVHRFITEHTFEEKINQLLQSKKELADLAVSTGEKWIGNFSDQELRDLVQLEV